MTFEEAISVIDGRENWPETCDLVIAYWQTRTVKNYDQMAILYRLRKLILETQVIRLGR